MTKQEVRARIEEIAIIPAVRVSSAEDAEFAAEAVSRGGIPIVEITTTIPGAIRVVANLVRTRPDIVVGAGTVMDVETAQCCLDAGVSFLTSPGLDLEVMNFALKENILMLPGALTPSEVHAAWKAGADFVKVFPCGQVGGAGYIRALKAPFPDLPMIASGGVTQQNAPDFIAAGAVAVGVGAELIPPQAVEQRKAEWIHELSHRFAMMIKKAKRERASLLAGTHKNAKR